VKRRGKLFVVCTANPKVRSLDCCGLLSCGICALQHHISNYDIAPCPHHSHLQHKQRQGIHTDAAAALAPSMDAAAAAAAAARSRLDAGASVGMRLWQQSL
jgi:ribosomal protein L36